MPSRTEPTEPTIAGGALEAWLTLCLPWLVALVLAAVPALVLQPRPALSGPRQFIVGAFDEPDGPSRLMLFDLAASTDELLARPGGASLERERVRFEPETIQGLLGGGIDGGATTHQVEVYLPRMQGEPLLLVTVRPSRLWPPAPWDIYLYQVTDGAPVLLIARRDEPAPWILRRDWEDRPLFESTAMRRRGERVAWRDGGYRLEPIGAWHEVFAVRVGGLLQSLRWWMLVLAAGPVLALLVPVRGVAGMAADLWPYALSPAREVGLCLALLAGLALAAAGLALLAAMRAFPAWDHASALLLPVLVALPIGVPLAILGRQVTQRWS